MIGEVKLDIDDYNKLLKSSFVASNLESELELKINQLEAKYAEQSIELNKHNVQLICNFLKGITNKVVDVEGDISKKIKSFSVVTVENKMILSLNT